MNVHTDKQQDKMARNKTDHFDLTGCTLCARTTQPGFILTPHSIGQQRQVWDENGYDRTAKDSHKET